MNQFRIGDKVKRIKGGENDGFYLGDIGTVTRINGNNVDVKLKNGLISSGNDPQNLQKISGAIIKNASLKDKKFFILIDSPENPDGIYRTVDDVKNSCSGGEIILEVKVVKKYRVVNESVKLLEIK